MTKATLGELETLVLLAVARRPEEAYAVTVREDDGRFAAIIGASLAVTWFALRRLFRS